jgi:glucose-1-phosphate thymidylyltransferase
MFDENNIKNIFRFIDCSEFYNEDKLVEVLDNNIKDKGEFQLTNALESMKQKGFKFTPGKVDEWLDCGNKDATVYTNQRVLELKKGSEQMTASSAKIINSVIIEPCYIGENAVIENSVVGPHTSIGKNSIVKNSLIRNSILQNSVTIADKNIANSMIGSFAQLNGKPDDLSLSDYSTQA